MLAVVKCLFWTVGSVTEPKLVLAHLSFSPFTPEYQLHLDSAALVIQCFHWQQRSFKFKKRRKAFFLHALRTFLSCLIAASPMHLF